jgi:hypothetical protein
MQSVVYSIRELFVGVEVLGSQPDPHLGEEMVIAWRQDWTVIRVVENLLLKRLIKAVVRAAVCRRVLSCRRMTPVVSILRRLFWIDLRSVCAVSQ